MVRKALYEYDMVNGLSRVAVALSGGKDSLTLLYMLKEISGRGFAPFEIFAVHVDGEFSCGAGVQKNYLQKICDEIEVPLIVKNSSMVLEKLECYGCSRERRSLLFEGAKSVGAKVIAFGHHRDDNAQTLLLNLLHKGEFAGNLPKLEMVDYGVTIIRPLIFVAEEQIRSFAKARGFMRTMCQCPVGQRSKRRSVELLLQEMEHAFPNARSNVARASLVYGSDKARKK